jgi:8-oxo-dGTP pyrophosphatase MutT (NUDIX family)
MTAGRADGLMRHILACNNADLPGRRVRLLVGPHPVGWVLPETAGVLRAVPGVATNQAGLTIDATATGEAARALVAAKLARWRDEVFDLHDDTTGACAGRIDRGALPALGAQAYGVHLNGRVRRADGFHLWVARRRDDRPLDPGKLDHLVAGGMPAGLSQMETLVKEAQEEAGMPAALAVRAVPVGVIAYAMERAEGMRRDRLYCYDVDLPDDFIPAPADDEVAGFELWPIERVLATVRETDAFKFNVNLVLIDLFLREGLIAEPEASRLRRAMDQPSGGAALIGISRGSGEG